MLNGHMDSNQSLIVEALCKTSARQFVVSVVAALMLRLSGLTGKSTFQQVDAFFVFACSVVAVDRLKDPIVSPPLRPEEEALLLVGSFSV